jgi:murein tripeptide amidase MpaA
VFIDGSHMVPSYGDANRALQAAFLENLKSASPDFQTEQGYADDRFTDEMMTLGSKWAAATFGCVSLTLEMPFKDSANAPDARVGWNGARSQCLGAAFLLPVLAHLQALE